MPLIIDRVTYKYLINDVVKVTKKLKNFFQKVIHPLKWYTTGLLYKYSFDGIINS